MSLHLYHALDVLGLALDSGLYDYLYFFDVLLALALSLFAGNAFTGSLFILILLDFSDA